MSLTGLSALINQTAQPSSAPNPTPSGFDFSSLLVPPSGSFGGSGAVSSPLRFAGLIQPVKAMPQAGASSNNGGTVRDSVLERGSNGGSAPSVPVPGGSGGTAGAGTKGFPPELQAVIDSMNSHAQDAKAQYDNVNAQIKDNWQNVQNLQGKIAGTAVPQMRKLQMSPESALAALAGSALMNNRYTPQAEQFTGNLLGGLQRNNEVDYQNASAQHQQSMQVLQNAIQAARDQGNNLRYLLPTLAKQPELDLASIGKDLTSYFNNQQTNQTKSTNAADADAIKQRVYDSRQSNKVIDEGLKTLTEVAPEARPAIIEKLKLLRPDLFGDLSDDAILANANPSAKEQAALAGAHINQIKAGNLGGLFQSQLDGKDAANANKALAQVDRVPHQMGLDDDHAKSFYRIISNYDSAHAANRAAIYAREYQNRLAVSQAQRDHDKESWYEGIGNEIKIQQDLLKSATDQRAALLHPPKGQASTVDDSGDTVRYLQSEIDHANRAIRGLQPIHEGQSLNPLSHGVLQDLYGNYYDPSGQNAAGVLKEKLSQPQITYSTQGKPLDPVGVNVKGPVGVGPDFSYIGGKDPGTMISTPAGRQPIHQVLEGANARMKNGQLPKGAVSRPGQDVRGAWAKFLAGEGLTVK